MNINIMYINRRLTKNGEMKRFYNVQMLIEMKWAGGSFCKVGPKRQKWLHRRNTSLSLQKCLWLHQEKLHSTLRAAQMVHLKEREVKQEEMWVKMSGCWTNENWAWKWVTGTRENCRELILSYRENEWGSSCTTNIWREIEWVERKFLKKVMVGWSWWMRSLKNTRQYMEWSKDLVKSSTGCKERNVWRNI